EDVEITLLEAGPYVSFANCGLPYYVGGEIAQRDSLLVVSAKQLASRFNIKVCPKTTAIGIDRGRNIVVVRDRNGSSDDIPYDRLILATGTEAIRPPIPGLDRENIFTVRSVPDVDAIMACIEKTKPKDAIMACIEKTKPKRAMVIGGGYIGLETAEQLLHRGLVVTVVEMADQLMLAMDAEMALPLQQALEKGGAEVILSDAVAEIVEEDGQSVAVTASGRRVSFDLGIQAVGVRPNVELAKHAGLELGESGAIKVDAFMRTSDPAIYAAGDNSELPHAVLGKPVSIPLAGPANKAGRIAGANAALDLADAPDDDSQRLRFGSTLGTACVRVCGASAACTGLSERAAQTEGVDYAVMYMPGWDHAGYYPGAEQMVLKVLYAPDSGKLLGAQATGGAGVDKRIDVIATAILWLSWPVSPQPTPAVASCPP
ncbi:MAG: FAD-dependent oxidoreductase, partial [Planctomycetota bacterium]